MISKAIESPVQLPMNTNKKIRPEILNDVEHLKLAFKVWHKKESHAYLGQNELCKLQLVQRRYKEVGVPETSANYGMLLKRLIEKAIEELKPNDGSELDYKNKNWHDYLILHDQYVKGRKTDYIRAQLADRPDDVLPKSTFQRWRGQAISKLAVILQGWELQMAQTLEIDTMKSETALRNSDAKSPPLQWPRREGCFIGRATQLNELKERLQSQQIVSVCGPGGVGKSALVAEAVWQLPKSNLHGEPPSLFPDGLIYCDFYRINNVENAMDSILISLDEQPKPDRESAVRRALAGKRLLLILEGTEQTDSLFALLNLIGSCTVLITSRRRGDGGETSIDLDVPALEEAVSQLKARVGMQVTDDQVISDICELIGRLPLAIRLAGANMNETEEQPEDFLHWLKDNMMAELQRENTSRENIKLMLRKSLDQVSEQARDIVAFLQLIAHAPFGSEMVMDAFDAPSKVIRDALNSLVRFSILRRYTDSQRFEAIHALIREYGNTLSLPDKIEAKLREYVISLVERQSLLGEEGYLKLDEEREHLFVLMKYHAEKENWNTVYNLTWPIKSYLHHLSHMSEGMIAIESGVAAAKALGKTTAQASFLYDLAVAYSIMGRKPREELSVEALQQVIALESNNAGYFWLLGIGYHNLKQYEEAVIAFQQAIALDPNNASYRFFLGKTYETLKWDEEAITAHQQAVALEPDDAGNYFNLGVVYYELERYEEAITAYQQAIVLEPSDPIYHSNLGLAYYKLERHEEAIIAYKQAIALESDVAEYHSNLGKTYRELERYEEAIVAFQQAIVLESNDAGYHSNLGVIYYELERYEEAIRVHQQAIAQEPDNASAHSNLGAAYCELERYEKAIAALQQAVALEVDNAGFYSNLGVAYYRLERCEEAITMHQQAIVLEPDNPIYHSNLGLACDALERYEEAVTAHQKAVALEPNNAQFHLNLGITYNGLEQYEEALNSLNTTIKLDPNHHWAYETRGIILRTLGQYNEAIRSLQQAERTNSTCPTCIGQQGQTYLEMGQYDEAIANFNRAINLVSDYDSAIAYRGEAYLLKERYEHALADFDRALELIPDNAWVLGRRGLSFLQLEQYEKALTDFDRALELMPDYAQVLTVRGETYLRLGQYQEALADFDRALELVPDNAYALGCRGETHLAMQNVESAKADFDQTLTLNPEEDWSIYLRGLSQQLLGQLSEAKVDYSAAIQLAQNIYEADPQLWANTFNLALYFCVQDNEEQAIRLYQEGLVGGATLFDIRVALRDLDKTHSLISLPPAAKEIRQMLAQKLVDADS